MSFHTHLESMEPYIQPEFSPGAYNKDIEHVATMDRAAGDPCPQQQNTEIIERTNEQFRTQTAAVPTSLELLTIWRANTVIKAPRYRGNVVLNHDKWLKGFITPTIGSIDLKIPTQSHCNRVLYLPDVTPLDHGAVLTQKPGTGRLSQMGILNTLMLNREGNGLIAYSDNLNFINMPPSKQMREFLDTRRFFIMQKRLITLLRKAREQSQIVADPNLIPGVTDEGNLNLRLAVLKQELYIKQQPQKEFKPIYINKEFKKLGMNAAKVVTTPTSAPKPEALVVIEKRGVKEFSANEAGNLVYFARQNKLASAADWIQDTYEHRIKNYLDSNAPAIPFEVINQVAAFQQLLAVTDGMETYAEEIAYQVEAMRKHAYTNLGSEQMGLDQFGGRELSGVSVYEVDTPDQLFPLPDNNAVYRTKKTGVLHAEEDLPAVMLTDGTRMWYKDGKKHRDHGFAVYMPAKTKENPSDQAIYEFWRNGVLCNPIPDHPVKWGSKGDRLWLNQDGTPGRSFVYGKHLPSEIVGNIRRFYADNGITIEITKSSPESVEDFAKSLKGKTGFLETTIQQQIDAELWKNEPVKAAERARLHNALAEAAIYQAMKADRSKQTRPQPIGIIAWINRFFEG